jgi:hypothetical protein
MSGTLSFRIFLAYTLEEQGYGKMIFFMHVHHVPLNGYQFFYSGIRMNSKHVELHVFSIDNLLHTELLGRSQRTLGVDHKFVVF